MKKDSELELLAALFILKVFYEPFYNKFRKEFERKFKSEIYLTNKGIDDLVEWAIRIVSDKTKDKRIRIEENEEIKYIG